MATARGASSGSARTCAARVTTSCSRVVPGRPAELTGYLALAAGRRRPVGQLLVGGVADLLQGQPARRGDRHVRQPLPPGQHVGRPVHAAPALADREAGADQGAHHGVAERVGDHRRATSSPSVLARPATGRAGCAPSSRPRADGRTRRSRAHRAGRAAARPSRRQSSGRPCQSTSCAPQRVGPERVVADPVGVAAPERREPGVEAGRGETRRARTPMSRGRHARQPATEGAARHRRRPRPGTSTCTTWPRACTPASVRPAQVTRTRGSRSTVASAPSTSAWTVRWPGWRRPAREVGAVVGQVEAQTDEPAVPGDGGRRARFRRRTEVGRSGRALLRPSWPRRRRPRRSRRRPRPRRLPRPTFGSSELLGSRGRLVRRGARLGGSLLGTLDVTLGGVVGGLRRRRPRRSPRRQLRCAASAAAAFFAAAFLAGAFWAVVLVAASASPTVSAFAVSASTSSMTAIGALSPLRGPILVMRV